MVISEHYHNLEQKAGDRPQLLVYRKTLRPALELAGADDEQPAFDVEQEEAPAEY